MMKVAKSHNTSLNAIKLSDELKSTLPIWYHISASKRLRRLDNTSLSKCLRNIHIIKSVADIVNMAKHTHLITGLSDDSSQCSCPKCSDAYKKGCKHPLSCCEAAGRLLHSLDPKWMPGTNPANDGLTLTTKRRDDNQKALDEKGDVTFDPSLTERGGISETFRVF
ncbi:uncharacterized protein C8Q71DRAFT_679175, partial [Rhodofomes roseus]